MNRTRKPVLGMILKGYPRISESFISNEILLLEKQGFKIHLFSMRHPRESFSHRSVQDIRARVDYLPHSILKGLPQFLFHNTALLLMKPRTYTRAIGIACRRFLRTRKSATFKHLLQAGYLVHKLLPGKGIVHLHAHFAHSPSSVAMFASWLSGLDFSFTAHAKDIYTSDSRQLREKMKWARFVVTCTEYNRQYLKKISGNQAQPVHRIYHGIDIDLFSGNPKSAAPLEPYQIFTVARLVPKKGLPTVYRALTHLREKGIAFRHTLVGDGDDREKILSLIEELGLKGDCRWMGTLPHERVLDLYRKSDLFVLGCEVAGNGDRDGIPNVFMESMAMGVPVVGTRVSAIPELVVEGRTGLLVPPGQPVALAAAMIRLLTDGELREKVVTAARNRVDQEFDNKRLVRDLVDVYRQGQPLLH